MEALFGGGQPIFLKASALVHVLRLHDGPRRAAADGAHAEGAAAPPSRAQDCSPDWFTTAPRAAIVVSHVWDGREHADPRGHTLRYVCSALRQLLDARASRDVADERECVCAGGWPCCCRSGAESGAAPKSCCARTRAAPRRPLLELLPLDERVRAAAAAAKPPPWLCDWQGDLRSADALLPACVQRCGALAHLSIAAQPQPLDAWPALAVEAEGGAVAVAEAVRHLDALLAAHVTQEFARPVAAASASAGQSRKARGSKQAPVAATGVALAGVAQDTVVLAEAAVPPPPAALDAVGVWLDWLCVPQGPMASPAESAYARAMLCELSVLLSRHATLLAWRREPLLAAAGGGGGGGAPRIPALKRAWCVAEGAVALAAGSLLAASLSDGGGGGEDALLVAARLERFVGVSAESFRRLAADANLRCSDPADVARVAAVVGAAVAVGAGRGAARSAAAGNGLLGDGGDGGDGGADAGDSGGAAGACAAALRMFNVAAWLCTLGACVCLPCPCRAARGLARCASASGHAACAPCVRRLLAVDEEARARALRERTASSLAALEQ